MKVANITAMATIHGLTWRCSADMGLLQVHRREHGHARAEQVLRILTRIEHDLHRHALDDLDVVPGRVFRREQAEAGPGGGGQNTSGTLLVTGVSAGAESDGSQFVTITGVINGPTVREHEVYARMQMAVGTAPSMGQLMPVVYSAKNPDKWGIVATPPPAPPHEPPHEPWPPPAPSGPTELR